MHVVRPPTLTSGGTILPSISSISKPCSSVRLSMGLHRTLMNLAYNQMGGKLAATSCQPGSMLSLQRTHCWSLIRRPRSWMCGTPWTESSTRCVFRSEQRLATIRMRTSYVVHFLTTDPHHLKQTPVDSRTAFGSMLSLCYM